MRNQNPPKSRPSAVIFDIKRYAIHDGPGIRTTVFFKGCPLSCLWCHNPESQSINPEKMVNQSRCIGCGRCAAVCPEQACRLTADGIVTNRDLCRGCGACAEACPALAAEITGRKYSVDEVMAVLEKEQIFFDQSGGGVTFSGGEPLMQADFLVNILKACGQKGIHRVVDTCGYAPADRVLETAQYTDLFLYDLKILNSDRHRQTTGVGNELILKNLTALCEARAAVIIRIPLIHEINDDDVSMAAMAAFIRQLPGSVPEVELLPFHDVAGPKLMRMGRTRQHPSMGPPKEDRLNQIAAIFKKEGIETRIA